MELCAPAIIYLVFATVQIILDLFAGMFNTAAVKAVTSAIITMLLNLLCKRGLTVVSWIIVFIPFVFMTTIVAILLYAFGLNPATGKLTQVSGVRTDASGNILIFDPNYNASVQPVYYKSPNIVVPNPHNNDAGGAVANAPTGTSSPAYYS